MDCYPALAPGSGQFSTNRWNPPLAGLYVARRVGFSRITVPRFALSPMSLRNQQLVSTAKICRWSLSIDVAGRRQCALAPTAVADEVPARPLPAARRLCPRFIPLMQETLLPHAVLTLDASQKYANPNLSITLTWMTRPASGWRWRFIGRPTSTVSSERVFSTAGDILTDKRSACQLITPKNFWFWKKICLNFELAATLNNVNLMD